MNKHYYITTPIYYPSGKPHMGHAYSSIIADVFARFMRLDNHKVFFLTGTDEHGLKIQKAALKAGLDPLEYCNKISKIFRDFAKKLNFINSYYLSKLNNELPFLKKRVSGELIYFADF